jgi:glycosyltransferase involved in cell wall biosynthesis
MKIVVNCQQLPGAGLEGDFNYINQVFSWLIKELPQHDFVFITGASQLIELEKAPNCQQLVLLPTTKNGLLLKWWHNYKLPSLLKKNKADILINAGGFGSISTSIPQLLILTELPIKNKKIWRKYIPPFIKKSAAVAIISEQAKNQLHTIFKVPENKLVVTGMGVSDEFAPVDGLDERHAIKDIYSNGREYFLFSGTIDPASNIIHLLKAFSLFKKRQRSNMQLLLEGTINWPNMEEKLATYKFKNDVHLLGSLPEKELAKLMGAAYAFVYPTQANGFALPVLQAMRSGLPVLASNENIRELAADGALYSNASSPEELAAQLMMLYKDENRRSLMIAEGLQRSQHYSWKTAASTLWQAIEKAVNEQ